MELSRLFSCIVAIMLSLPLFSQDNVVKTGATDMLTGHFNLSWERMINEKSSIQFRAGYWNPAKGLVIGEEMITPEAYTLQKSNGGINLSLEYRFYLSRRPAPQGFYVAPYIRSINQEALYEDQVDNRLFDVDTRLNSLGAGAQIGYQFIFKEIVSLDFYFLVPVSIITG